MTSNPGRVLADTHALVWYFAEDARLSSTADGLIQNAERGELDLIVPTIVLIEAIRVVERKDPGISVDDLFGRLSRVQKAVVAPLDMAILEEVLRLPPALEMHDRIIAATARVYGAQLISRDRQLGSLVDTVW